MKLFSHYVTAPDIIHVEIHQRVLLQSSLMQPENGMLIGWFSCPTHDCNNEWDRHWIADIYFREKINIENPHFDAHLNGTLLIKEVLPMYDGRYFIVRVQTGLYLSRKFSPCMMEDTSSCECRQIPELSQTFTILK